MKNRLQFGATSVDAFIINKSGISGLRSLKEFASSFRRGEQRAQELHQFFLKYKVFQDNPRDASLHSLLVFRHSIKCAPSLRTHACSCEATGWKARTFYVQLCVTEIQDRQQWIYLYNLFGITCVQCWMIKKVLIVTAEMRYLITVDDTFLTVCVKVSKELMSHSHGYMLIKHAICTHVEILIIV